MMTRTTLMLACLALLPACGHDHDHDHAGGHETGAAHGTHGEHGGHLIELGAHVAHLEVVHDDAAGTLTLYVTDAKMKPMRLEQAPVLNLPTDEGPKQLIATSSDGAGTTWVFVDDALEDEPDGARLRVVHDGVTYTPEVAHDH